MWLTFILLASVALGAGAALQKHGIARELPGLGLGTLLREPRRVALGLLANRLWLAGGGVSLCGAGLIVLALRTGELSVVQPLANLNLVVSVLAGTMILHERLSNGERLGVAALIGGAVLVSISGLRSTSVAAVAPARVLVLAAVGCGAAVALLIGARLARMLRSELALGASAGLLFGLGTVYVKALLMDLHGIVGFREAAEHALFSPALVSIGLANLAAYAFEQLAFSHGRVAVVDPLCTGGALVLPVSIGALVLGEELDLLRALGLLVLLAGLVLLLWRPRGSARDERRLVGR